MRLFLLLLQLASVAKANTEKTIFVAPSSITLPNVHPGLDNLCLDVLSPNNSSLHVQLPVAFPNEESPRGIQSWYLLDRLQPGQRYELRLCWVATVSTHFLCTYCYIALYCHMFLHFPVKPLLGCLNAHYYCQQPTEFWLDTYTLTEAFETPDLIQSLSHYAEGRDSASCHQHASIDPSITSEQTSLLFLRVNSAADYFSKDPALMISPPLVGVDISA